MRHFVPVMFALLLTSMAAAGEPQFRTIELNLDAEYPACAVFDVNGDGKLDIFSGGSWYAGPDWQRHVVREVEQIGGRYDDYSNLPLDVDGDGWTDVVSCNYRSQSLYWVRHPGQHVAQQTWQKTLIEAPGPMETGRLVDVDSDGKLDILPNGTTFAAWWQLKSEPSGPRFERHDLPPGLAGHGIGSGDIDGDGRLDLVGAAGWWRSTEDGQWAAQPEFRLTRDASIPILVWDVDRDGDADLVWGRGHRFGLYWLEQLRDGDARQWQQHTIDSTLSQAHALLQVDLDGDQQLELVAGPRYLGHEGRDVGEYDPLSVYWYKFDPQRRSWQRGVVSSHPRAALGLDPAAADLDGDGDTDLVLADRSGLLLCENLGTGEDAPAASVELARAVDHQTLMQYRDAQGQVQSVTDRGTWAVRRAAIVREMQQAMGGLPPASLRVPLDVEIVEQRDQGSYVMQRIRYTSQPSDRVPAWLMLPKNRTEPGPAMLCLHQTIGIGKDEPAGLGGSENLHYAQELAERGYVTIVPDYPSFGEYAYDFQAAGHTQHYVSGTMKAIWNNMRAVDLLQALPNVDPDRIGCIGHSLGGHNSLYTAVFDQRLQAVVTSCGFNAFHHYYEGNLAGWTSDRYMPRIRDMYNNDPDQVPFDFYEVLAAIAPRAIFVNAPLGDSNFEVTGVKKVEAAIQPVFELYEANKKLAFQYPDTGHDFPPEVRRAAYEWLDQQLGRRGS